MRISGAAHTILRLCGAFVAIMLISCATETRSRSDSRSPVEDTDIVNSSVVPADSSILDHESVGEGLEQDFEQPSSDLAVRPAILLDRSYTIQIGLYDHREEATAIVAEHQLVAEEAGIAAVTIDGNRKYLLAYGIYSDEEAAEEIARQMADRLQMSVTVVSLAEVEAISQTVEESPGISTF